MAVIFTPNNIVSNGLGETISTFPKAPTDLSNPAGPFLHGSRALIFNYPLEANVSLKRIEFSLAEVDGDGTSSTNVYDGRTVFGRLLVLRGYKKDLIGTLFDPFYTPSILSGVPNANGGNVVIDAVTNVADVRRDAEAVLVDKLITRVGDYYLKLEPPIENLQDQNLVVILTPLYATASIFWAGVPPTSYPKWASWIGSKLNTGAGIDNTQQQVWRTLRVTGCQK